MKKVVVIFIAILMLIIATPVSGAILTVHPVTLIPFHHYSKVPDSGSLSPFTGSVYITLYVNSHNTVLLQSFLNYLKNLNIKYSLALNHRAIFISATAHEVEKLFHNKAYLCATRSKHYYFFTTPYILKQYTQLIWWITGFTNYTSATPNIYVNSAIFSGTYSPVDIQDAYDVKPLLAGGFQGEGNTIAIVDAYGDPSLKSDLQNFSTYYKLPPANFSIIYPFGHPQTQSAGWALETAVDVEYAHALAPKARILIVIAPDAAYSLQSAVTYVIDNNLANIVSLSWGAPEQQYYTASLHQTLKYATTLKITVIAAAGDNGSANGVEYPASDPYITSVGGTSLYLETAGTSYVYGYETAWDKSGGGYSKIFKAPPWQEHVQGFNSTSRGVPDIALDANMHTGVNGYAHGAWYIFGGTSLGPPLLAGMVADLNSFKKTKVGFLNPYLYSLANSSRYKYYFHDVVDGSNGVYTAGPGWDAITGLGSINLYNIAKSVKMLDFQVGAKSKIGTNYGIGADIRMEYVYPTTGATNYFWIGENLTNTGFVKFGYFINSSVYGIFGEILHNTTVIYTFSKFVSLGVNNTLNSFCFVKTHTHITFYYNFKPIQNVSLKILTNLAHPKIQVMYAIAESKYGTSVYTPLGPVEFEKLRYLYQNWTMVSTAMTVKRASVSIYNPYSVIEVPFYNNDFLAGLFNIDTVTPHSLWPENYTYTPRTPIIINSSTALTLKNGIFPGTGTTADPYRIVGWKFNSTNTEIYIKNITVHITVAFNTFHGGLVEVMVLNAQAVTVKNNTFFKSFLGIFAYRSNILILNNTFKSNKISVVSVLSNLYFSNNSYSNTVLNTMNLFSWYSGLSIIALISSYVLILLITVLIIIAIIVFKHRKRLKNRNV